MLIVFFCMFVFENSTLQLRLWLAFEKENLLSSALERQNLRWYSKLKLFRIVHLKTVLGKPFIFCPYLPTHEIFFQIIKTRFRRCWPVSTKFFSRVRTPKFGRFFSLKYFPVLSWFFVFLVSVRLKRSDACNVFLSRNPSLVVFPSYVKPDLKFSACLL